MPQKATLRSSPLIHDLVLAVVFLSMTIAPAITAVRSDDETPEL